MVRAALFSWRFIIPLVFFVNCNWKIISALRRSAQVGNISRSINVSPREQHTTGQSTSNTSAASAPAGAAAAGTSSHSKPPSSPQKNVIKTMIVVTSCFIVCWLPVQFTMVAQMCGLQVFGSLMLYTLW